VEKLRKNRGPYIFDELMRIIEELMRTPIVFQAGRAMPLTPEYTEEPTYTDIVETDKEIILTAELPSFSKEDIRIHATENEIEIAVEAKEEECSEHCHSRCQCLSEKFGTPAEIIPEKIKAKYKNGILEIKAPKKNPEKRRKINID